MERQGEASPTEGIRADHVNRYAWALQYLKRHFAATSGLPRLYLDAGCGVGYGSLALCRHEGASVLGVDVDPETIAHAVERCGSHLARRTWEHSVPYFEVADIQEAKGWGVINRHLKTPGLTADAVVMFENIEHLSKPVDALKYFASILRKPTGLLLVSAPNQGVNPLRHEKFVGDKYPHLRHYTRESLAHELYRGGFLVRRWYGQAGKESTVEPEVVGRTWVAVAEKQ